MQLPSGSLPSVGSLWFVCGVCLSQLVVNIENGGGELYQEEISSNVSQNLVSLRFVLPDGTNFLQLMDFSAGVSVQRFLGAGEMDLDQEPFAAACYVTWFSPADFIAPEAISKLRQRNPASVRRAEEALPLEAIQFDLIVDFDGADAISPHIHRLCKDSRNGIYIREQDLRLIAKGSSMDILSAMRSVRHLPQASSNCSQIADWQSEQECFCSHSVCIEWFPCGLKWCKSKEEGGAASSYRCGIKTCRKCTSYSYFVARKMRCLWSTE